MAMDKDINKIPEDALKWRLVEDYSLQSPLGQDLCRVEMLDSDDYQVLRPGEDDRIRRTQIRLFCEWLIQEKEAFDPEQLRYILTVLSIKQSVLAKSMPLTEGSMSQFLNKESNWKPATHRQVALLFLQELQELDYILKLAKNKAPTVSSRTSLSTGFTFQTMFATTSNQGAPNSFTVRGTENTIIRESELQRKRA